MKTIQGGAFQRIKSIDGGRKIEKHYFAEKLKLVIIVFNEY